MSLPKYKSSAKFQQQELYGLFKTWKYIYKQEPIMWKNLQTICLVNSFQLSTFYHQINLSSPQLLPITSQASCYYHLPRLYCSILKSIGKISFFFFFRSWNFVRVEKVKFFTEFLKTH